MFAKADHVAMSVRDMEKVIAFYQDIVGMEKVFDRVFGEEMGRLIGVPGTKVRIVHMKLNDSVVELFDYTYPEGREPTREHQQRDLDGRYFPRCQRLQPGYWRLEYQQCNRNE